jgi:glycosyltransferase involved in cell wall biosynthesis
LAESLTAVCENIVGPEYRLIFVDDGSQDNSFEILNEIRTLKPKHITIVKLFKNSGQLSAIFAGYEQIKSGSVVTISADLQDDPNLITEMYENHCKNFPIVACYRKFRNENFFKRALSHIAYRFARINYPEIPKGGFDYFLIGNDVLKKLMLGKNQVVFLQGRIVSMGYLIYWLPYTRRKRRNGKSQWTLKKKIDFAYDIFFDSSFKPLRVLSAVGFLILIASFLQAVGTLVNRILGKQPFDGFTTLVILLCFFGGITIFSIGLIGEYLLRILRSSTPITPYAIDSVSDSSKDHLSSKKNFM